MGDALLHCSAAPVHHRCSTFWRRSARALSRYSDMVDSLARSQMELLEGASDDARTKLREWELPEALQVSEERGGGTMHACERPQDLRGAIRRVHKPFM